jgi:hypothetical protein
MRDQQAAIKQPRINARSHQVCTAIHVFAAGVTILEPELVHLDNRHCRALDNRHCRALDNRHCRAPIGNTTVDRRLGDGNSTDPFSSRGHSVCACACACVCACACACASDFNHRSFDMVSNSRKTVWTGIRNWVVGWVDDVDTDTLSGDFSLFPRQNTPHEFHNWVVGWVNDVNTDTFSGDFSLFPRQNTPTRFTIALF